MLSLIGIAKPVRESDNLSVIDGALMECPISPVSDDYFYWAFPRLR